MHMRELPSFSFEVTVLQLRKLYQDGLNNFFIMTLHIGGVGPNSGLLIPYSWLSVNMCCLQEGYL